MEKQRTKTKTIVIWLDAGTFDVIMPMLDRGRLPAFQKIMMGGVSGTLISTIPPLTAPAWASFATGVNPGKHGVYDFWERKGDEVVPVTSYSIRRVETLWSMLNEVGKKVILINAPMTYPPRRVNGLVVTGLMTPGNVPYTYPENLRKKLLKKFPRYLIFPETNLWEDQYLFLERTYDLMRQRRDMTLYLIENYDWDFLVSVFYCVDQIQHSFWKYMDPTHPAYDPDAPKEFKDAIAKAYEIVDNSIKELLERMDEDTMLIVMSDHGAGPLYKHVFMNNYLRTIGVLSLCGRGTIESAVDNFLGGLEVRFPLLSKFVPGTDKNIFDRFRAKFVKRPHIGAPEYFFKYVDWTRTKAYSLDTFGQIFINQDALKSNGEYESLIEYLIQKLLELKDPEDGKAIVDEVFKRSQIYQGEYVNEASDLFCVMRRMTYLTSKWFGDQIVRPSTTSGHHRMEGILIMYGNELRRGYALKDCNIIDLAPTILHWMGLRVPSDIDGRILRDAFHPSFVRKHPVRLKEKPEIPVTRERYVLSKEEEQKIKERLRALGYM